MKPHDQIHLSSMLWWSCGCYIYKSHQPFLSFRLYSYLFLCFSQHDKNSFIIFEFHTTLVSSYYLSDWKRGLDFQVDIRFYTRISLSLTRITWILWFVKSRKQLMSSIFSNFIIICIVSCNKSYFPSGNIFQWEEAIRWLRKP